MLFTQVFPMLVSCPAGKIKRAPWVRDSLTFDASNNLVYLHDGEVSDRKVTLESLTASDWEFIAPIAPASTSATLAATCPHCGMPLTVTVS